jgi:hypothetical protein
LQEVEKLNELSYNNRLMERSRAQKYQVINAFLDCVGNIWVFSPHNKPDGSPCELTTTEEKKLGKQFIIEEVDANSYFGRCNRCWTSLLIPKNKLRSNC